MTIKLFTFILIFLHFTSCCQQANKNSGITSSKDSQNLQNAKKINENGKNIVSRILLPENFERITCEKNSFGEFLRNLHLKSHNTKVMLFNGEEKYIQNIHVAVIDIDVGTRDLQQCADAIIRLRGEYLYSQGFYEKMHFNLTNGFRVDYLKWKSGYRVKIEGNKTEWVISANESNTYENFRKYMDFIFMYAGTLSLSKELIPVAIENLNIGDVFIQGGSPGHAVIIVDVAQHKTTGEEIFLLAQSYMPAQDIHILINPDDEELSPWYSSYFGENLHTPEWTFYKNNLKRFSK